MRVSTTRGAVCLTDEATLLEYRVAAIEYTEKEDGSFRYVITPNYSVIGLLEPPLFQGIPGLNLDTHRKEFVRENRTPVFISERTPAENREDVRALLEDAGMEYLNRLEWLIRTDSRYSGDNLYVLREEMWSRDTPLKVGDLSGLGPRSAQAMKAILNALCFGRIVEGEDFRIDDSNRFEMHALLRALYAKEKSFLDRRRREGTERAAQEAKYRGRQPRPLDDIKLAEVVGRYRKGSLSADQAADELGISRATFFRRIKVFQES